MTAGRSVVLHTAISWPLLSDAIDAAAPTAAISGPPSMSRSTAFSSEESLSTSDVSHVLSHPLADIVLRSRDLQEFKVPKVYIIDSSPVLAELIRSPSHPPETNTAIPTDSATLRPVVPLTDSAAILTSLLSFIIPVSPNLPSTVEECVELLWTAQQYEMGLVLTRIRDHVAQQDPPIIRDENAFYVYSLAKKYGLRREADQAARLTLKVPISIGDLEASGRLDILSGALLHELWGYHQRVREYLAGDFAAFMMLGMGARINFRCTKLSSSDVPIWLNDYINSVAVNPALFNLSEFHMALTRHVVPTSPSLSRPCQSCAAISCKTIDTFWKALSDVVEHSIENVSLNSGRPCYLMTLLQAESDLFIEGEMQSRQSYSSDLTANILPPQMENADVVLVSSDDVHFHVHKSILSMSSAFFRDMFSLPQPTDSEFIDGLPAVRLSEGAEVLHKLVTLLYPIPSVIPDDYDKALALLAVSHKYDMAAIELSVRAEMKSRDLRPLTSAAIFRAYGFASVKGLTQEMESAARLTLDFPMTFEFMGDELATFGGWALRDLARYRKRCRDSLVPCLESLLDPRLPPSDIWAGCHNTSSATIARWLQTLLSEHIRKLEGTFTHNVLKLSGLRAEYLAALQSHVSQVDCTPCSKAHTMHGETFCVQVEKRLSKALDGVSTHNLLFGTLRE